jgi:hypothetical protein
MDNPFNTPIKKGRFYKELADSILKLPIDTINIIYHYAKNDNDHSEYYNITIDLPNHLFYNIQEITILGDNLYIKEYQYDKFGVYDLKTFKFVDTNYTMGDSVTFHRYVKKYLCSNKYPIRSGYCPNLWSDDIMTNFWSYTVDKNRYAYSDKYIFHWNPRSHSIRVYDKSREEKESWIDEKYLPKENNVLDRINLNGKMEQIYVTVYNQYCEKNIMVYNNILYVIGYYSYHCFDAVNKKYSFSDNYIHLYDVNTLEFMREFTKTREYDTCNRPICMAITDELIVILLNNQKIDVYNREDCF